MMIFLSALAIAMLGISVLILAKSQAEDRLFVPSAVLHAVVAIIIGATLIHYHKPNGIDEPTPQPKNQIVGTITSIEPTQKNGFFLIKFDDERIVKLRLNSNVQLYLNKNCVIQLNNNDEIISAQLAEEPPLIKIK